MSPSPFQDAAPALTTLGYSVIPLAPRSKYPVLEAWSRFCSELPSREETGHWLTWKVSNIGLCLGPASGVVALDFDHDVDGLHGKIQALLPDSPVKKRGAKGFTAFYTYCGERNQKYSCGGQTVLEILSSGRQTVLPPSLHPDGCHYEWITPNTLADVQPHELPRLTAETLAAIHALFKPEVRRNASVIGFNPWQDTTGDEITEALSFIPADDYDDWIRVGMALKAHLGEAGLSLWDRWSATSSKYDAKIVSGKWRSFHRSEVTIGTLFFMAMERGYINAPKPQVTAPRVHIEEGGNLRPVRKVAPAADILSPPGMVGRISRWINETALYPQPVLAVAAAIGCAGAVMAHKIQSPTRLRTNFYTLGLAPSGAGKDHARKCVVNLLRYSDLDTLIGGEPASSAGLLTAIREGGGKCVILWDEFGRVLKTLSGKNASSHQSDILRAMVELFSCSGSVYAGVQYADHDGKMKRKPIDQPCLSIYGTTVPENFFNSLTHSDAIDGFLARFLVMESRDYTLKARKGTADINEPPEDLLAELRRWKEAPSNYEPRGNVDGALRICPMVVSYDPAAEALIDAYSEAMRARVIEESNSRSGLSSIYARCAEHAIKLALAAHEGDTIGVEAMRWGIATADWCCRYLAEAIAVNVADNEFERVCKRVLGMIGDFKGGWMPHSALVKRTQGLSARQRGEALENLAAADLIDVDKVKVEGTHKPATVYRRR